MIVPANDFFGRFGIVKETRRINTILSRPIISFDPKAASKPSLDGAAHFESNGALFPVNEFIITDDKIVEGCRLNGWSRHLFKCIVLEKDGFPYGRVGN